MEDTEIDIGHLLGIARRQRKLILATVFLMMGVAVILLFAMTPKYTSTALLLVDPSQKDLLTKNVGNQYSSADGARVDSEVEIVSSDRVLVDVISNQKLVKDEEFGVKLGLKDKILVLLRAGGGSLPNGEQAILSVLSNFKKSVSVHRKGLTYLIEVNVTSKDAQKAATLANAVADAYIQRQISAKIENARNARDVVLREASQAQADIVIADKQYEKFVTEHKDAILAATGSEDIAQFFQEIETLTSRQTAAQQNLSKLNADLQKQDWQGILTELESESVATLVKQRRKLEQRIGSEKDNQSEAINLAKELKKIDEQLQLEVKRGMSIMAEEAAQSQKQLKTTWTEFDTVLMKGGLPTDLLAQIYGIRQTSNNETALYKTLLSRSQALETETALQVADSRVVSNAFPASQPSSPNKKLIIALGLVGGLGVGFILAFLFEHFISGFFTEEQIEEFIKVPAIASIKTEKSGAGETSLADKLVSSPMSRFAESLRRVQVAIQHSLFTGDEERDRKQGGSVILVTSTLPSEGKTTVALSLARSYALSGKRSLIIDLDLRKPSVHTQLNKTTPKGIDDFLMGDLTTAGAISSIAVTDDQTSLIAILGTKSVGRPTDRLVTKMALGKLIEIAAQRFDVTIIDTPPVEPVVDALYLAEHADTIIYIVRWAKTSSRLVKKSINMLKKVKRPSAKIFAILNHQDTGSLGGYNGYNGYYSDG